MSLFFDADVIEFRTIVVIKTYITAKKRQPRQNLNVVVNCCLVVEHYLLDSVIAVESMLIPKRRMLIS